MSHTKRIVLYCPQGYQPRIDILVEEFMRAGVIFIGVVGCDCQRIEDIEIQQVSHQNDGSAQESHPRVFPQHSALIGTGKLDFLPRVVRDCLLYPAYQVSLIPGMGRVYDDYLNLWYHDPIQADPPTGW